jgi:hypothetical protein
MKQPNAARPYRVPGYPLVPFVYILVAATILFVLFTYPSNHHMAGTVYRGLGNSLVFVFTAAQLEACRVFIDI